jgi:hypothetical protein
MIQGEQSELPAYTEPNGLRDVLRLLWLCRSNTGLNHRGTQKLTEGLEQGRSERTLPK